LSTKGDVWGLGQNKYGQLGKESKGMPLMYALNMIDLQGKKVVDIKCGSNHSIVQCEDGQLMGCGSNNRGQLGLTM